MRKRTKLLLVLSICFVVSVAFYLSACVPNDGPAEGNMTLKRISVDRGNFTYRESGLKNGTPVIMVHGWPENSYTWDAVAGFLKPRFHVIAPDLRGLGDSERTLDVDKYQKAELAQDIIAIADGLGIDSFYLVGHDWGGVVAQEVALAIPERVKKLVILNIPIILNLAKYAEISNDVCADTTKPYSPSWYQDFQKQPNLPEAMIPGNEVAWVSHFFIPRPGQENLPQVPEKSIIEYVRAYSIADTPATAASLYRSMAKDSQHWLEMLMAGKTFAMPGLYIYGNLDSVIIPDYLDGIEAFFRKGIEIVEIEASHFVQEQRPEEVAQAMNEFFLKADN